MSDMKRSFAQRGAFVEVTTTVEKEMLDSKTVLQTIRNFDAEIGKVQQQYTQIEKQKADADKALAHYKDLRKQVGKFEEWALNIQKSKVKALIAEVRGECEQKIRDSYVPDSTLTEEQNKLQMFRQLQHSIGTHSKVAAELDQDIIKHDVFTHCNFENPFL